MPAVERGGHPFVWVYKIRSGQDPARNIPVVMVMMPGDAGH
jgi:hypothetical protein